MIRLMFTTEWFPKSPRRHFTGACRVMVAIGVLGTLCNARAADNIDFGRDIRPLLSNNCFQCHGPNEGDREGGFRLDRQDSAFGDADSGARPIVAGEPGESELIARITSTDDDERMPPPDSNKSLTKSEIELIRKWIEGGAAWQDHWSLVTPRDVPPPTVKDKAWARNEIDNFVLARLEEESLRPAAEADKLTIVRRVTFDLTGLPPTRAEVESFLKDDSPAAFEKLVDRLLRSPHFGEHMARFWLDAARYGDTHGLHLDNYREMWPYRNWVIEAFNINMPYDQFTIEQLAGDLLPHATLAQQVATGFNRAHVTTNEGGSIKEEVYVRNVVDRVVTVGTVFMGMTFECSRCHDHKFDPFTMDDFYSMFAYFNSLDGSPMDGNRKDHAPVARVPTESQQGQLTDFDQKIAAREAELRGPLREVDLFQKAWEEKLAKESKQPTEGAEARLTLGDWYTVGPFADNRRYLYRKQHGPEGKLVNLDDDFKLATGQTVKWVRRSEWTDGKPHVGLLGDVAGNFLYRTITAAKPQKAKISLGSDDAIKVFLNNKQVLAKDVARGVAADQDTVELPLVKGENQLLIKIMNYGGASGFYFSLKSGQAAIPEEILKLVVVPSEKRSQPQQQKLRDFYRNKVAQLPLLDSLRGELTKFRGQRADVDRQIPTTLVWRETKEPRPAFHLKRGQYDQRGDEVNRRTPRSFAPMDESLPNNRLGFAKWLVDPNHPLTARVAVNRLWLQVFGTGIVKTAEDFGSQGEPPSHPELLDWLAARFVEDGWDVKAMVKRIVMSATYRQSSRVTSELYERDPENRLLARGPRFRLDAEMLRDQALLAGGLLVDKIGGPSVKPPQPGGLWFAVGYSGSNTVRFKSDEGPDKVHRRSLYTFIKRTAPPPQMSIIDAPSREACVMRRERTNTPLLSLLLFNDPQFVEAARALAERTLRESGTDARSRAAYMFQLCTCRPPTKGELDDLVQGFNEDLATYKKDPEAAKQLISVGQRSTEFPPDPIELAAWTMTANLLFNLDEVVTKN